MVGLSIFRFDDGYRAPVLRCLSLLGAAAAGCHAAFMQAGLYLILPLVIGLVANRWVAGRPLVYILLYSFGPFTSRFATKTTGLVLGVWTLEYAANCHLAGLGSDVALLIRLVHRRIFSVELPSIHKI